MSWEIIGTNHLVESRPRQNGKMTDYVDRLRKYALDMEKTLEEIEALCNSDSNAATVLAQRIKDILRKHRANYDR